MSATVCILALCLVVVINITISIIIVNVIITVVIIVVKLSCFAVVSGATMENVFRSGFWCRSTVAGDGGSRSSSVLGRVVEASNSRRECATIPSELACNGQVGSRHVVYSESRAFDEVH